MGKFSLEVKGRDDGGWSMGLNTLKRELVMVIGATGKVL
jgi:hypothetical protein